MNQIILLNYESNNTKFLILLLYFKWPNFYYINLLNKDNYKLRYNYLSKIHDNQTFKELHKFDVLASFLDLLASVLYINCI